MKTLGIIFAFVFFSVLVLAFGAGIGLAASWVLTYFGLNVPWYVCWVGLIIIGMFCRGQTK